MPVSNIFILFYFIVIFGCAYVCGYCTFFFFKQKSIRLKSSQKNTTINLGSEESHDYNTQHHLARKTVKTWGHHYKSAKNIFLTSSLFCQSISTTVCLSSRMN